MHAVCNVINSSLNKVHRHKALKHRLHGSLLLLVFYKNKSNRNKTGDDALVCQWLLTACQQQYGSFDYNPTRKLRDLNLAQSTQSTSFGSYF